MSRKPPGLEAILSSELRGTEKPPAFVVAGHNGSGKSTLWYQRLAPNLQIPLVNADRLTLSILPERDKESGDLPVWAQRFRDENRVWHGLSQDGVRLFRELIMQQRQPFGFETVFSHWRLLEDGTYESKIDDIVSMQRNGYFVVLVFVGLANLDLSILRVQTRRQTGGHDVPIDKLRERFPRTQQAIGAASKKADLTLMLDNSLDAARAFQFVRAQRKRTVLFDARDPQFRVQPDVLAACTPWLDRVVGPPPKAKKSPGSR